MRTGLATFIAALLAGGCGSDSISADSAQIGADASAEASAEAGAESGGCVPLSCAQGQMECGTSPDGCGGVVACGQCAQGLYCGGAGPNRCGTTPCTPKTCLQQGASCGAVGDGCSAVLSCGACTPPQTCGGAGVPNQCGCTPTTCAAMGAQCGDLPDGCGGTLACGTCPGTETCGGAGVPHKCGCKPKTCAQLAGCGSLDDSCGGSVTCGCPGNLACISGQCCPGEFPVDSFDATPAGTLGVACDIGKVLASDNTPAGLDFQEGANTEYGTIDGQLVSGCVGVDFGAVAPLGRVVVRARAIGTACGTACKGDCGLGRRMLVFAGKAKGTYHHIGNKDITGSWSGYEFPQFPVARYVVVCRPPSLWQRDDVQVDAIRQTGCH